MTEKDIQWDTRSRKETIHTIGQFERIGAMGK